MRTPRLVIQQRAASMRAALTGTEAILRRELRAGALGVSFRRQVPIGGKYIADFYASRVCLVVEVDGGYHAARAGADARRDRFMVRHGYRVLRLPAALVQHRTAEAVALVRAALTAG